MAYVPNSGSVAAFLEGNASVITRWQDSSIITVGQSSIAAVIIGGSVATSTTNSSVMLLNSPNSIGSVTALQGTLPWAIAGSVAAAQIGTAITSLVSTVPSSVIVGASIFGQLPGGTAQLGSVVLSGGVNAIGSVAVLQGTNPWLETFSNSSIIAVPVGSVITVFQSSSLISINAGSVVTIPQGSTIAVFQSSSLISINAGFYYVWNVPIFFITCVNPVVGEAGRVIVRTPAAVAVSQIIVKSAAVAK